MVDKIENLIYFIIFLTLLSSVSFVHAQSTKELQIEKTQTIEDFVKKYLPNEDQVTYTIVPRGLIISVSTDFLFNEAGVDIKQDAYDFLYKIGCILKAINKPCVVEGNALTQSDTDTLSNMELSIIRADEIVEFLIQKNKINPNLLRAIGFGNILPFYDNVSYKGHLDKRIDFVIFNYETER